jgi:3-oxoadipate enol-lactonase
MAAETARTRDGIRITYEIQHGGAGPRIALIHSLGMDRSFWREVTARLAGRATTLTYDCRGHGQSDKPAGPYRIEQFADDLADLLDHVGWTSAIVAGASMGGCITLAFAAAHPTRASALGLFDTTAWYNAPDKWEERATKAVTAGLNEMIEFQTTRWFTDPFRASHPDVVKRSVEIFLANDPKAYAETCRMLGACNVTAALRRLTMPAAIVVGEEDYATPVAMAQTLHGGLAGSTLTVLKNARHLTVLEQPDAIAAALESLIGKVGAR